MALGFELRQTMAGTYYRVESPGLEHRLWLSLRAQVHGLRRFAVDPEAELVGEIAAEGLAPHRPLRGKLHLRPLRYGKIVYELRFADDHQRPHRLRGQHEIELLRPLETLSTMTGSIFDGDDDREVARFVLHFHLRRELVRMLRSLRIR